MPIDQHPGRRAATEIHHAVDAIKEAERLAPRATRSVQHPAVVLADRDVIDPCRAVTRQMVDALAIGFKGEDLPRRGKIEIVGIPEAVGHDLARLEIGCETQQRPLPCFRHRRRG